jgi:hypothetical protein
LKKSLAARETAPKKPPVRADAEEATPKRSSRKVAK